MDDRPTHRGAVGGTAIQLRGLFFQLHWLFGSGYPRFSHRAGAGLYLLQIWGISVTGLFSDEYEQAPWSFAKVIDLLKHLWIPMIIIGISGTAGLIRVMRANLLDELHKPYVEAARAKGLPEWKLLIK
ncbi:MAG: ABC transporter permease subunit, partial [Anaerolineae bacterium]